MGERVQACSLAEVLEQEGKQQHSGKGESAALQGAPPAMLMRKCQASVRLNG